MTISNRSFWGRGKDFGAPRVFIRFIGNFAGKCPKLAKSYFVARLLENTAMRPKKQSVEHDRREEDLSAGEGHSSATPMQSDRDQEAPEGRRDHAHQLDLKSASEAGHEAILADVISKTIIPTLLSQNSGILAPTDFGLHPSEADIQKLSAFILGPDNADALDYIYSLRDRGISLDSLHLELLEPTARHLGELWDKDEINFFDVTVGISRLQRIVHHFSDLDRVEPYDDKRRALIMVAPGEDHNFGNQIVQKFMRAAGWGVLTLTGMERDYLVETVSREWFAVIGFSISGHTHIDALAKTIKVLRARSLNPHIGIMVGGPMVAAKPELVEYIGADGTASNAASAVILAKKLLAQGLAAEAGLGALEP
ncbi:MAG: cobalamin B12-binding domain-containing protein [Alphaproteobacteria bacterium]|nr:cobalamin B12-binding domain-containing protein [Alphaproteobacteria bacterium]